jgi:CheY-like chemotaxis protein
MLAASLKQYGYKVVEACNGAEALELSASHSGRIDLLITDVIMPGMTGCDLAGKLTAVHKDLKVLYISGYAANLLAEQDALGAGMGFLHKPFTMSTLAVKVREVLGTERSKGQTGAR